MPGWESLTRCEATASWCEGLETALFWVFPLDCAIASAVAEWMVAPTTRGQPLLSHPTALCCMHTGDIPLPRQPRGGYQSESGHGLCTSHCLHAFRLCAGERLHRAPCGALPHPAAARLAPHPCPNPPQPQNIRRARVWDDVDWMLIAPRQAWRSGEVTSPKELTLLTERQYFKLLAVRQVWEGWGWGGG